MNTTTTPTAKPGDQQVPDAVERLRAASELMMAAVDDLGGSEVFWLHCVDELGVDEGFAGEVANAGYYGALIADAYEHGAAPWCILAPMLRDQLE